MTKKKKSSKSDDERRVEKRAKDKRKATVQRRIDASKERRNVHS